MSSLRGWSIVALVLAVGVAASGCRSRRGSGSRTDLTGTNIVTDPGLDLGSDLGMGDERLEGDPANVKFEPVYFDYDSSQVKPSERSKIEPVADYLRSNAPKKLIIEGHCDERGSAEYNLALGERRALAVRSYLVGLGIDGARVQTSSFGEERPAAQGTGEAVWRLNRRAEFVVIQ